MTSSECSDLLNHLNTVVALRSRVVHANLALRLNESEVQRKREEKGVGGGVRQCEGGEEPGPRNDEGEEEDWRVRYV